jgi:hypothetical protein
VPRGSNVGDFAAEVTAYRQSGADGTYGLLFGLNDDASSYTTYRLDHRGRYSLQRVTSNPDGSVTWETLVPWTQSPAVRAWAGINNLLVVRRATQLTLYANGQRLATVDVTGLPSQGRVGLIAGTVDAASAEHRFDNFRLYRIASGSGP